MHGNGNISIKKNKNDHFFEYKQFFILFFIFQTQTFFCSLLFTMIYKKLLNFSSEQQLTFLTFDLFLIVKGTLKC